MRGDRPAFVVYCFGLATCYFGYMLHVKPLKEIKRVARIARGFRKRNVQFFRTVRVKPPKAMRRVEKIARRIRKRSVQFLRTARASLIKFYDVTGLARLVSLGRYFIAYRRYSKTGEVPADANQLLSSAFLLTNGWLMDDLVRRLARRVPPIKGPDPSEGILPPLSETEFAAALAKLSRDGIYIFSQRLDARVCDELYDFACRTPCTPAGDHILRVKHPPVRFDPGNPIAPTYWFNEQTLAECPLVQRLFVEPAPLKLAQAYLGMEPILNVHTMWWSVAFKKDSDSRSAQQYHFDLQRARFLKLFVYLVDVTEENGPHMFVRGTHIRKNRKLLTTNRIPDEDIFACYPRDREIAVTGPRGTVFLADTRGFHKGLPVARGTRLVFQMEYDCDRFGQSEPIIELNQHFGPEFRAWQQRHPRFLCRFTDDPRASTTSDLQIV